MTNRFEQLLRHYEDQKNRFIDQKQQCIRVAQIVHQGLVRYFDAQEGQIELRRPTRTNPDGTMVFPLIFHLLEGRTIVCYLAVRRRTSHFDVRAGSKDSATNIRVYIEPDLVNESVEAQQLKDAEPVYRFFHRHVEELIREHIVSLVESGSAYDVEITEADVEYNVEYKPEE